MIDSINTETVESSPEKAGVGGSIPSLATIENKAVSSTNKPPPDPKSVRLLQRQRNMLQRMRSVRVKQGPKFLTKQDREACAAEIKAAKAQQYRQSERPSINRFEGRVKFYMERAGWHVLRNGWPDFLCIREAIGRVPEIVAVEVKHGRDKITTAQNDIHQVLIEGGIPVYIIREASRDHDAMEREQFHRVCLGEYSWNNRLIRPDEEEWIG
jgi:hypothetical protein